VTSRSGETLRTTFFVAFDFDFGDEVEGVVFVDALVVDMMGVMRLRWSEVVLRSRHFATVLFPFHVPDIQQEGLLTMRYAAARIRSGQLWW
jgi:hypothetical protein